jgi:hypothetical protein
MAPGPRGAATDASLRPTSRPRHVPANKKTPAGCPARDFRSVSGQSLLVLLQRLTGSEAQPRARAVGAAYWKFVASVVVTVLV